MTSVLETLLIIKTIPSSRRASYVPQYLWNFKNYGEWRAYEFGKVTSYSVLFSKVALGLESMDFTRSMSVLCTKLLGEFTSDESGLQSLSAMGESRRSSNQDSESSDHHFCEQRRSAFLNKTGETNHDTIYNFESFHLLNLIMYHPSLNILPSSFFT